MKNNMQRDLTGKSKGSSDTDRMFSVTVGYALHSQLLCTLCVCAFVAVRAVLLLLSSSLRVLQLWQPASVYAHDAHELVIVGVLVMRRCVCVAGRVAGRRGSMEGNRVVLSAVRRHDSPLLILRVSKLSAAPQRPRFAETTSPSFCTSILYFIVVVIAFME